MNDVTIIAEAGVNHNGDIAMALNLIEAAAAAGADIVKFQTFKANKLATVNAQKAQYQKYNTKKDQESQIDMLNNLELSLEDHKLLIEKCKECKIEFLSTGFDIESLDILRKFDLKRYKIPSGEITNLPYLKHIATFNKPIIMSTGMSNILEIESAIKVLENSGLSKKNLVILQCTTEYPTPINEVNLRVLETISSKFSVKTGLSDHSSGILVASAAVALGASVIEKHITLNKNLEGPDHIASIEPGEFKNMVDNIREIEKALGDGIKKATESEQKNIPIIRKSIVAIKKIKKGDFFSYENIGCKRPGTGISPMRINYVLGKPAIRNFKIDELIEL